MTAPMHVALLRGINLGSYNRISMPELRAHLTGQGYGNVQTIVASGNIVLESDKTPAQLQSDLRETIAERFGVDTPVICRTARQMATIVKRNPFPHAGGKALHVLFLEKPCPAAARAALEALDLAPEQVVVSGREIYAHYATGYQNSQLAKAIDKQLPKQGTDRNWNTVLKLRELTR